MKLFESVPGCKREDPQLLVSEDTIFYVAAPAKVATGGPELLHQLSYHLRVDLGYKTYMYYIPPHVKEPVNPAYADYNNPFVKHIDDEKKNILIVPEVIPAVRILKQFSNIQKVIWWLSVDNFIISYVRSKKVSILALRVANKALKRILGRDMLDINDIILSKWLQDKKIIAEIFQELQIEQVSLHLCQSYYAMNFLASFSKKNVAYLSDYLNREFLVQDFKIDVKEDIVAFNPKKASSFTYKVIASAPGITFVPIENMTRNEVIELLKKTKVYIDFGNHPGKDRIPREAAILGCCVLVGKRGSAANEYDVPIPEKYKFEPEEREIPKIVETIRCCLTNYKEVVRDFDSYREAIKREPDDFIKNVIAIFSRKSSLTDKILND